VSTTALKITLNDKALRAILAKLPDNLNERARKKGARKALAPFVKKLAGIWKSSPYRGKPTHRKAIAAATQLDVRRMGAGPTAPIRSRIGVRYGTKGGATAKGRQRVYHLLELGYRHYGKGSKFYASTPAHLVQQREGRREFVKLKRNEIFRANPGNSMAAKRARSAALFGMYGEARAMFPELHDHTSGKRQAMKGAGAAKMIPGAFRSLRWAQSNLQRATDALGAETLAEAKRLLGGRP
jgi:hypothetical protein